MFWGGLQGRLKSYGLDGRPRTYLAPNPAPPPSTQHSTRPLTSPAPTPTPLTTQRTASKREQLHFNNHQRTTYPTHHQPSTTQRATIINEQFPGSASLQPYPPPIRIGPPRTERAADVRTSHAQQGNGAHSAPIPSLHPDNPDKPRQTPLSPLIPSFSSPTLSNSLWPARSSPRTQHAILSHTSQPSGLSPRGPTSQTQAAHSPHVNAAPHLSTTAPGLQPTRWTGAQISPEGRALTQSSDQPPNQQWSRRAASSPSHAFGTTKMSHDTQDTAIDSAMKQMRASSDQLPGRPDSPLQVCAVQLWCDAELVLRPRL